MNIAIADLHEKILATLEKSFTPEQSEKIADYLLRKLGYVDSQ